MTEPKATACPCGRTDAKGRVLAYAHCCGRWLDDFAGRPAPDAESLMRSRYTAFVLGRADYLLATWHPRTRPGELPLEPGVKWLGLEVRWQRAAGAEAEVEFIARSRLQGRAQRLHERSRFVREADGRWYYLDAATDAAASPDER
jgi:SEC-C motif-containing protein